MPVLVISDLNFACYIECKKAFILILTISSIIYFI